MKYLILLFLSQNVMADNWFCRTQHAKRDGNIWTVCGQGVGLLSPEMAKQDAVRMAQLNFESLCRMSSDCKNHEISVNPKRMECVNESAQLTRCYQEVEITVLDKK